MHPFSMKKKEGDTQTNSKLEELPAESLASVAGAIIRDSKNNVLTQIMRGVENGGYITGCIRPENGR